MRLPSLSFYLLFVSMVSNVQSFVMLRLPDRSIRGYSNDIRENHLERRLKRTPPSIVVSLLKTAELVIPGKDFNIYLKEGGFQQALRDFRTLKAEQVGSNWTGRWGLVENHVAVVKKEHQGATLRLWERQSTPDGEIKEVIDEIQYLD